MGDSEVPTAVHRRARPSTAGSSAGDQRHVVAVTNGCSWRDLPERFGPWQTVYERFAGWEADGAWAHLLEEVQVHDESSGAVEWTVSVDSTINRAHQRAAGARKKGATEADETEDAARSQARQALGRSRGGLTTKVHLAVDGRGLPLSVVLTPGRTHDAITFAQVLDSIHKPRVGRGRPRTTPDRVLANKAYSSRSIRQLLRPRGITATIPERRDQVANRKRRGSHGGRQPAFDKIAYRDRNVVERSSTA